MVQVIDGAIPEPVSMWCLDARCPESFDTVASATCLRCGGPTGHEPVAPVFSFASLIEWRV